MDLQCSQCGVEYQLDAKRVMPGMSTARCARCGQVFALPREALEPSAGPDGEPAPARWMVRQPDGTQLSFQDLTVLWQWILERKVTPTDEISRTGQVWTRLGEIVELARLFEAVDSASGGALARPVGGMSGSMPAGAPVRLSTPPAPAVHPGAAVLDADDPLLEWSRSQRRRKLAVGGVLLLLALGTGLTWGRAPLAVALGLAPPPAALQAVQEARQQLLLGSPAALQAASTRAQDALALFPGFPDALAWNSLATTFLALGAAEQETELTALLAAVPADAATVKPLLEKAQRARGELLQQAFEQARDAHGRAPNGVVQNLAVAAYHLARQQPRDAQPFLQRAADRAAPGEPLLAVLWAELDALTPESRARALQDLDRLVGKLPEARLAQWRVAAWLVADKKLDDARAVVDALLLAVPDHARAQEMKQALAVAAVPPPAPVPVVPPAPVPEPAPPPKAEPPAPEPAPVATPKPRGGEDGEGGGKTSFAKLMARADKLRQRNAVAKAMALYAKAIEVDPGRPEPHVGMGWCFLDQEKPVAAISEFDYALRLDATAAEAHVGLGEVYKFRGDSANALKNYRAYLELAPHGPDSDVARSSIRQLGGK